MKGKLMKGFVGGRGSVGWKDSANMLICILEDAWPFIPLAEHFSKQGGEKLIKKVYTKKGKECKNTNFISFSC